MRQPERWLAAAIHADIRALLLEAHLFEEHAPAVSIARAVDDKCFSRVRRKAGGRQFHRKRGVSGDEWADVFELVPVPSNHISGDVSVLPRHEAVLWCSLEHPRQDIVT